MEIYVYSRRALDAVTPHEVPHVVISVTSSADDVARLRENPLRRGVLRLAFPDANTPSELYPESVLFSRGHASQIWRFVRQHQHEIERIIVHCDAGRSRSPEIAAGLARGLNGDDAEFFGGRYQPNPRVYYFMLLALLGDVAQSTRSRAEAAEAIGGTLQFDRYVPQPVKVLD